MTFHTIDYIILGVIGLSIITGLFRGFIKELIALCVWILAIWLGFTYAHDVSPWLKPYIDDDSVRTAVSFIIILLVTVLVGGLFNALLSFVLRRTGLSGTDRVLGMIFGFARGIFIVALVIVVLNMTSLSKKEDYAHRSVLYSEFDPIVNWLTALTPDFIKQAKIFDKEAESSASTHPS